MENPLLVFISSVIADMRAEREAAEAAIRAIPLSRPWVFEHSPASALLLAESYLRKVRECDIFVLLLGATLTDPVKREVETAQAAGKPLLVFLSASAPADVIAYAQALGVKYATYQDTSDLAANVAEAVGDELITGYRRYRVPPGDLGSLGDFLGRLAQGVVQIGGAVQVGRDQTIRSDLVLGDKIGSQVNTEGGTYVEGNLIINPETDAPEELLRAYYRCLAVECSHLPLGVIDKEFVRASGGSTAQTEEAIPLPDIYVDLDVVAPAQEREKNARAWALQLSRGEGKERTPLLDALGQRAAARTVLLGDAGSGKTTFVNYLGYLLAADPDRLPEAFRGRLLVRLVLREVAARHIPAAATAGTAAMLWNALADDIATHLGKPAADSAPPLSPAPAARRGRIHPAGRPGRGAGGAPAPAGAARRGGQTDRCAAQEQDARPGDGAALCLRRSAVGPAGFRDAGPGAVLRGAGGALYRALVSGRARGDGLECGHRPRQRRPAVRGTAGAALPWRPGLAAAAADPDGDAAFQLGPVAG